MGLHSLLRYLLYFLYVDDVRTSQQIRKCTSTACYGDSFTFEYVDDVHTSQGNKSMGLHGLLRY
jgi:hypothetical protein